MDLWSSYDFLFEYWKRYDKLVDYLLVDIGYKEAVKWNRERLENDTDVFVCPTQFMADKMAQGGFDRKKLVPLCNFIDTEKCKLRSYIKGIILGIRY